MDADPLGQNDKGGPPGAAAPTGGEEEMDADPLGQNDKDGPRKKTSSPAPLSFCPQKCYTGFQSFEGWFQPMNVNEICLCMQAAERKAAKLMLRAHDVLAERKSGARDVVTEYDRRVQELLIAELRAAVPEAHFFCEELGEQEKLDSEHVFIIDPIDGTMNFVRGFSHSCIAVAYASCGKTLASAVYNPYLDEMFHAVRGGGAFLNGRPIRTAADDLENSVVCFGTSPYRVDLAEKTFSLARKVFEHSLDLRREGTAELDLCSVAAGRAGLSFELWLSLWDYAAGALLVEEAGGVCLTAEGRPLPCSGEKSSVVAAASPAVMDAFMTLAGELL